MYVRDCYKTIADQLLGEAPSTDAAHSGAAAPTKGAGDGFSTAQSDVSPLKCALILGPKGIGKTMFLNYLMVRIVEKARSANTFDTLSIVYYHKPNDVAEGILLSSTGCCVNAHQADYYLSDSIDIADGTLGRCLLLEVASENQKNYEKFKDRLIEKNGSRLIMDVWSVSELMQVKHDEWNEEEVKFLHGVFGGRVRHFLGGNMAATEDKDDIDETAVWFFGMDSKVNFPISWNRALSLIRETISDAKGKAERGDLAVQTSLFWVVHSNNEAIGFSSTFLKLIAGRMNESMGTSLWNELGRLVGGGGQGLFFESLGHMKLTQTDREFTACRLQRPNEKKHKTEQVVKMKFNVPKVLIRSAADIVDLPDSRYGLPIVGNFMLVDAIVKPNVMLQFTVATSHGRAGDTKKWTDIRKSLGGERKDDKLIFVIPAGNIGKFTFAGVPDDLHCYYMTYEDVANDFVTTNKRQKKHK